MSSCEFVNYLTKVRCNAKTTKRNKFCAEHLHYFKSKKAMLKRCMYIIDYATGETCTEDARRGKFCEKHLKSFGSQTNWRQTPTTGKHQKKIISMDDQQIDDLIDGLTTNDPEVNERLFNEGF